MSAVGGKSSNVQNHGHWTMLGICYEYVITLQDEEMPISPSVSVQDP